MGQLLVSNTSANFEREESARVTSPTDEQADLWFRVLQDSPQVACAVRESHPYGGGSGHPDWEVLFLLQTGARLSCLWLKSLDPVQVFVGRWQLAEKFREELLRPVKMGAARWHLQPNFKPMHQMCSLRCPLMLDLKETQCTWDQLAQGCSPVLARHTRNLSYVVKGTWHSSEMNTLVVELKQDTRQCLFWVWLLQQMPLLERLHPLVLSFLEIEQSSRWVYMLLTGYKFKGRGLGVPLGKTYTYNILWP